MPVKMVTISRSIAACWVIKGFNGKLGFWSLKAVMISWMPAAMMSTAVSVGIVTCCGNQVRVSVSIHDVCPTSKQCDSNSDPVLDQCTRRLVCEVPKYYSSVVCCVPRLTCREVQAVLHCSQRRHAIVPRQQVLDSLMNRGAGWESVQLVAKVYPISTKGMLCSLCRVQQWNDFWRFE